MSNNAVTDLPLFSQPGPMVRASDPLTSHEAAYRILPKIKGLRLAILRELARAGEHGMTDNELRYLPQFAGYAHSTVGKRRTELTQWGAVVAGHGTRDGFQVWQIAPDFPIPTPMPVEDA